MGISPKDTDRWREENAVLNSEDISRFYLPPSSPNADVGADNEDDLVEGSVDSGDNEALRAGATSPISPSIIVRKPKRVRSDTASTSSSMKHRRIRMK